LQKEEIKKKAKIKKPKFVKKSKQTYDENSESEEIEITQEDKIFWQEFNKKYGRRIYSKGVLNGTYVFWSEKQENGYKVFYTDEPENPKCTVYDTEVKSLPKEISWMRKLADQGLKINGRKTHPEDDEPQPKNSTTIAEILASVKFKFGKSIHKLFLIRYLGEWLGSAVFVKREDLITASLLLKSFEEQEKLKKGRIMEYQLEYNGFTGKTKQKCEYQKNIMKLLKFPMKNNNEINENIPKNARNEEKRKKKKGRKRVFAVHSKNRKWELGKMKAEFRKEGTCLFNALKCLCPLIPPQMSEIFLSKKAKQWKGTKLLICNLIKKYCPGFYYEFVKEKTRCKGILCEMIREYLDDKIGNYLFCYQIKGSLSGHSGVIKKGVLQEVYQRNIKVGHNPDNYRVELDKQDILMEDLNREICKFYSIKIMENSNEKF